MDMKNLKKVAITLCSLIVFISPLANADVITTNTFRIECESVEYTEEICQLPGSAIEIKRKKTYSDWPCREHLEWDWRPGGDVLSAYYGCRGRFEVTLNQPITIQNFQCSSQSNGYNSCLIPSGSIYGLVWVYDRHSNANCKKGINWGVDGWNLWVNNGCRATFSTVKIN